LLFFQNINLLRFTEVKTSLPDKLKSPDFNIADIRQDSCHYLVKRSAATSTITTIRMQTTAAAVTLTQTKTFSMLRLFWREHGTFCHNRRCQM